MPSNPLTQEEINEYAIGRILNPPGYTGLSPYMPQGYFLSTPSSGDGPALWRLFDASFISSGTISTDRLGSGSVGLGDLYLADDGNWKAISIPPTPTLDQVTTAGNTTTNAISTGKITATDTGLSGTTRPLNAVATGADTYVAVAALYAPNTNAAGRYAIFTYGTSSSTGNSAELRFYYAGSNNSESRLEFAFNGYANPVLSATVGGKVLIGTTTDAGQKLQVLGNSRFFSAVDTYQTVESTATGSAGTIYKNTYRQYFTGTNYATANSWEVYDLTASAPVIHVSGATRAVGINKVNASYQLDVSGDIRSTIGAYFATTSGLVGIGTTSPSYKLDVNGSFRAVDGVTLATASGNVLIGTTTDTGEKLQVNGDIKAVGTIRSLYQAGDEGGEISFNKPVTNTTLNTGVTIDVYRDKLRIFETGGTNRGGYFDLSALAAGVGTNLAPTGWTGTINIVGNPPGQQNIQVTNGLITNVT